VERTDDKIIIPQNLDRKHMGIEAIYIDQKLREYNENLLIQALPPTFDDAEFIDLVSEQPEYNDDEVCLNKSERFHCVARLSSYFDPQGKTIELNNNISILIKRGYLARNPLKPTFASRSRQIYGAIENSSGKELERYVSQPTSASGLTLIGPSGMGKSTNLHKILSLYDQVIFHPKLSTYQIVWLKVDCPHAGSLKGLCTDIFMAIDKLLGTTYHRNFSSRNHTEDLMLAQVAQLAHTHHLGVLVIDEMQNLVNARRRKDDLLNFLVKMDNIIGVPVIKVGTNEALPIFQGNFRNARRGTGEGSVIWDRMQKDDDEWDLFVKNLWEYQWTRKTVELSTALEEAFYDETQGIIDIAIKLFRMVQCRSIALDGDEAISVDLIRQVANDGLHLLKPMLAAIRNNDEKEMLRYKDIAPLNILAFEQECLKKLHELTLRKNKQLQDRKIDSNLLRATIAELLDLDVSPHLAKECAEQVITNNKSEADISVLVKQAYKLSLVGSTGHTSALVKQQHQPKKKKVEPAYQKDDLRQIVAKAIESNVSAYEEIKSVGLICDPVAEYIN
jgi:AAA domain